MSSPVRQVQLARFPNGELDVDDFAVVGVELPEPAPGQVRCRTLAFTIGAGLRANLQGSVKYTTGPQLGQVIVGSGVAQVEASADADLAVGTLVYGPTGWATQSILDADSVSVVDPGTAPSTLLGVLGINGMAAYFGLVVVGRPEVGETVVVSAAAGSVGHLVGQLAKAKGCRVVGITSSSEKCATLTNELGFDVALSHRSPTFTDELRDSTPDGIDIYFDNTAGEILERCLFRLATHGRVVCCGAVSQYESAGRSPGPRGVPGLLVTRRARMEGFLVHDHAEHFNDARAELTALVSAGAVTPLVTTYRGLEAAPRALADIMAGATVGTTIVDLDSN